MSEAHAQLRFPMLVLAIGMGIALAYVLVADGDLDYGQRDSVQYYSVGLSIAQGQGLTVPFGEPGGPLDLGSPTSPLQFHPPGLPLVVSPLLALGLSPLPTLVVLQATFIALLGSVIAWRVHTATGSRFRAWEAALAGWSTGVFLGDQFVTEPLYLLMVTVVIGCLLAYVRRSDSRMLGRAVVIAAAASLVRVIGVALVLPAAAAIRTTVGELRVTFGKVAVVAGVVGGPVLVWILATAEHSNRSTVWHPLGLD